MIYYLVLFALCTRNATCMSCMACYVILSDISANEQSQFLFTGESFPSTSQASHWAKDICELVSHYDISCFTGVTLSNVSCNLSRFDEHMRLREHFHCLVLQTVATKVVGQMLHCAMPKNSLQPLRKVELNSSFRNCFCNSSRNVFRCCKVC